LVFSIAKNSGSLTKQFMAIAFHKMNAAAQRARRLERLAEERLKDFPKDVPQNNDEL
jgi:peptide subunit release factor 1 (eRF1)